MKSTYFKQVFLLLVFILLAVSLYSEEISVDQAKLVATSFIQKKSINTLRSVNKIELTAVADEYTKIKSESTLIRSAVSEAPEIYLFSINKNEGFIIVSGDNAAIPILGYSLTKGLDTNRLLPENLLYWLDGYRQQIFEIRKNKVKATAFIQNLWKGNSSYLRATKSEVLPMVKTSWDQSPFYNELCPYDTDFKIRNVVGCMATAMAQIIKYWNYPSKGFGVHAYKHEKYGVLSADFGTTKYNWSSMPDSVSESNLMVATLMYHCGIAVNMDYNIISGSGSLMSFPDATLERTNAHTGFVSNFGYTPSIKSLYRKDFSDNDWKNILINELDSGRPVLYGGFGIGYGHAFVCDGYNEENYFHFNWGWSGYGNGYFLSDALNPFPDYPFNLRQQILVGIRPKNPEKDAFLELSGNVVVDKPTIDYRDSFTITSKIRNLSLLPFNGDFCVAIFDENFLLVDTIDIRRGVLLNSSHQNTMDITFTCSGNASMVPGKYRAYILQRETGNYWTALKPSSGDSTINDFSEIVVENTNEISLYSSMKPASYPVYANDTISVWLNVENNSTTDFNGSLLLSIFTKEGDFVSVIEEKTNLSLSSNIHFTDSLHFYNDSIPLVPGVYMLKLMHKRDGSSYELTGSSKKGLNPVKIDFIEPLPVSDIYEVNDSLEIAFPLSVNYLTNNEKELTSLSNFGQVTTPLSNIHNSKDIDFYVVGLEPGYDYILNAMVHDKMVSNNGINYTLDAAFYYSTNGVSWSKQFDDESSGDIITDDTLIYFKIKPSVSGFIGTYMLDIKVEQMIKTSLKPFRSSEFSVYPNSFTDFVKVSCQENIKEYVLYNMQGRMEKKASVYASQANLDLSDCKKGMYVLKLVLGSKVYFEKLIKQ